MSLQQGDVMLACVLEESVAQELIPFGWVRRACSRCDRTLLISPEGMETMNKGFPIKPVCYRCVLAHVNELNRVKDRKACYKYN